MCLSDGKSLHHTHSLNSQIVGSKPSEFVSIYSFSSIRSLRTCSIQFPGWERIAKESMGRGRHCYVDVQGAQILALLNSFLSLGGGTCTGV